MFIENISSVYNINVHSKISSVYVHSLTLSMSLSPFGTNQVMGPQTMVADRRLFTIVAYITSII